MFVSHKDTKPNAPEHEILDQAVHHLNDAKEAVRQFNDDVQGAAARNDWEGVARLTGNGARELVDSASHNLTEAGQAVAIKIRSNPVQSSFIALALGLVVGKLLRR